MAGRTFGMILLGVLLIVWGLIGLLAIANPVVSTLLFIAAIVDGILLLAGR